MTQQPQREIKFRAWDEKLRRWEEWGLPEDAGYMAGRFNKANATKVGRRFSSSTLSQYTGLNDKNGKPIYEGDVFPCIYNDDGHTDVRVVAWHDDSARFALRRVGECVQTGVEQTMYDCTSNTVIGNIYENPELLTPLMKQE